MGQRSHADQSHTQRLTPHWHGFRTACRALVTWESIPNGATVNVVLAADTFGGSPPITKLRNFFLAIELNLRASVNAEAERIVVSRVAKQDINDNAMLGIAA